MGKRLIVFGGSTADEIVAVARDHYSTEFTEIRRHYFDAELDSKESLGAILNKGDETFFCIGIVDIHLRRIVETIAKDCGFSPFTIVHPTASIAESAKIGAGCYIAQQSIISVEAEVGDCSIIHFHSSIGHHAKLGRGVTVLPGARVSGDVCLGDGVLLGSNAFVFQGVKIGANSQIDAMTYVRRDIGKNMLFSTALKKPTRNPSMPD